jgi:hypothetical protein
MRSRSRRRPPAARPRRSARALPPRPRAASVDFSCRWRCSSSSTVALQVGLLDAHSTFTVRARPCAEATLSSLCVLRFSVILRGAAASLLGAPVRATQVRQQLELGLVADAVVGALDPDAGLVELREQLVDRDLQDLGELGDGDFTFRHPGRPLRPARRLEPVLARGHDQLACALRVEVGCPRDRRPPARPGPRACGRRVARARPPAPRPCPRARAGRRQASALELSSLAIACVSSTSRARLRSSCTIVSSNSSMPAARTAARRRFPRSSRSLPARGCRDVGVHVEALHEHLAQRALLGLALRLGLLLAHDVEASSR